jgi:transcription elongation factor Elf1
MAAPLVKDMPSRFRCGACHVRRRVAAWLEVTNGLAVAFCAACANDATRKAEAELAKAGEVQDG